MLWTKRATVVPALTGLTLLTAVVLGSVQPVAAQYKLLNPWTLPYAPPDLVVKVAAPAQLDYWYGDRFTITIDNTLTPVNGTYGGSPVNGVNVQVRFTGLTVVSVTADSGFVCLPVYPSGPRQELSILYCSFGAIPAGGRATITVLAGLIGVLPYEPAGGGDCWPAYSDARVSVNPYSQVVERDLSNNRAVAVTDAAPCPN